MIIKVTNRFSAATIHFSLSLIIFSIFIFVLLNIWYPAPFFTASGGWQGLKIVASVDLILGPALTLIIFNPKKSALELTTDLSLIAFVQISALVWGIITVYDQRPVAAVFWEDSFYTVPALALQKQGAKPEQLDKFGSERPLYIFAQQPQSIEEKEELIESILKEHIPPYHQIERFRPLESHFDEIFRSSVDIHEIINHNEDMKKEINELMNSNNSAIDDNYYIPMTSKYRNIILVFNTTGKLLGTASAPLKDSIDQ